MNDAYAMPIIPTPLAHSITVFVNNKMKQIKNHREYESKLIWFRYTHYKLPSTTTYSESVHNNRRMIPTPRNRCT